MLPMMSLPTVTVIETDRTILSDQIVFVVSTRVLGWRGYTFKTLKVTIWTLYIFPNIVIYTIN